MIRGARKRTDIHSDTILGHQHVHYPLLRVVQFPLQHPSTNQARTRHQGSAGTFEASGPAAARQDTYTTDLFFLMSFVEH